MTLVDNLTLRRKECFVDAEQTCYKIKFEKEIKERADFPFLSSLQGKQFPFSGSQFSLIASDLLAVKEASIFLAFSTSFMPMHHIYISQYFRAVNKVLATHKNTYIIFKLPCSCKCLCLLGAKFRHRICQMG